MKNLTTCGKIRFWCRLALLWIGLLAACPTSLLAIRLVVAADGSGDFTTIQAAINSLSTTPDSNWREIFIRNGDYPEKLFLEKKRIILSGESPAGVVIHYGQAREAWRCEHPDDWGAGIINVSASDIVLINLTLINDYGFQNRENRSIPCAAEGGTKLIRPDGHQFVLRAMPGCTRLAAFNCRFHSLGGDTVSPWDVDQGLYYFQNCTMEGAVDLYCPRGWAYAENCRFICHNRNAAIWHDGSIHESSKTVLKNCRFEGDQGFKLGRFHRESAFFLLNCRFASTMADADIYQAESGPGTPRWGKRVYYHGCRRKGGEPFSWYANNLPPGLRPKDLSPAWTFGGRWNPQEGLKGRSKGH